MTDDHNTQPKRTRRGEPISKRVAANGTVTYEFRVDVGLRPDGSRDRRRFTYQKLAEARREYRRITTEVASGSYTRQSTTTVEQSCENWLAGRRNVRAVTREGYRLELLPVVRRFGGMPLQSLSKQNLDEMVEDMLSTGSRQGKPLSVRAVKGTLSTLRAVLDDAKRQGLVSRNVAELVEPPRGGSRRMSTWTAEEAAAFAEHVAGERLHGCWRLTLAGLRRSEVLALSWTSVDFDTGVVAVTKSRVRTGSGTVVGAPKSARSRRVLPMPPSTMAALRALKLLQKTEAMALGGAWSDDRLIAVREDGEPIAPATYSSQFRRLCVEAGVPVIRLHDARHTSVSLTIARATTSPPSPPGTGIALARCWRPTPTRSARRCVDRIDAARQR